MKSKFNVRIGIEEPPEQPPEETAEPAKKKPAIKHRLTAREARFFNSMQERMSSAFRL